MTASPPLSTPRPANDEAPKIPQPTARPRTPAGDLPPDFAREVPALLLHLDPNPLHHGTLGAIRSLGRAGVEVHALLAAHRGPVSRSRYLERAHAWAPTSPSTGHEALLRTLWRIGERLGRPAVLIPMDEVSALSVARLRVALGRRFLLPSVSLPQVLDVADKERLALSCTRWGVPHPETWVVDGERRAVEVATLLGAPVVAKWARPWLLSGSGQLRSTTVLHHPEQARELYLAGRHLGSPLLLQRYVPPSPDGDWFFHGYFDSRSRLLFGGAGRKARSWPPGAGLTAVGSVAENQGLTAMVAELAAALGYQGVLDLDFRWDEEAGVFRLLDFNPRVGAQFRLLAGEGDMDVVRAQHLDLTGRTVPVSTPREARRLVVENYALLSRLAGFRGRGTTGFDRTVPCERELAWFAGDDPRPFAAMAASLLRRVLTRPWRRHRR